MESVRENVDQSEMLLGTWMKLEEIKSLVSVCKRGYDTEQHPEFSEVRSVLAIVEGLLGSIVKELEENMI